MRIPVRGQKEAEEYCKLCKVILASTGDPHGNFSRFSKRRGFFPEQAYMNKKDYMLIPGDFGGVWDLDGE